MGTASCPVWLKSRLRFQLFGGAAAASRPLARGQHHATARRGQSFRDSSVASLKLL